MRRRATLSARARRRWPPACSLRGRRPAAGGRRPRRLRRPRPLARRPRRPPPRTAHVRRLPRRSIVQAFAEQPARAVPARRQEAGPERRLRDLPRRRRQAHGGRRRHEPHPAPQGRGRRAGLPDLPREDAGAARLVLDRVPLEHRDRQLPDLPLDPQGRAQERRTCWPRRPASSARPATRHQTASFQNKPYAHRLDRGGMTCLDCHEPHARKGQTVKMTTQGELPCLNCHAEMRGPFVFQHVTGSGGDCLSCHQPHGSNNPNMLLWARVDQLCLSCHSQTGGPKTLRLAAAVVPRPDAAALPQLHDLPRGRPRLEPLAAAVEVGGGHEKSSPSCVASSSPLRGAAPDAPARCCAPGHPARPRGRLPLRRRLRQRADVPDADQRPAGRSCCARSTTPRRARSGDARLPSTSTPRTSGPGPAGQLRLQAGADRHLQADLHLAPDRPLQRPAGLRQPVPRRRDHPGPADLQPDAQHLRRHPRASARARSSAPLLGYTRNVYHGPGHDDLPPRRQRVPAERPGQVDRRALPDRPRLQLRPRPGRLHPGLALLPLEAGQHARPGRRRRQRDARRSSARTSPPTRSPRSQKNKINTPVTNAWVTGNLFGRLKLIGTYIKADGSNETSYVEADAGNFVGLRDRAVLLGPRRDGQLPGAHGLLARLGPRRDRDRLRTSTSPEAGPRTAARSTGRP